MSHRSTTPAAAASALRNAPKMLATVAGSGPSVNAAPFASTVVAPIAASKSADQH